MVLLSPDGGAAVNVPDKAASEGEVEGEGEGEDEGEGEGEVEGEGEGEGEDEGEGENEGEGEAEGEEPSLIAHVDLITPLGDVVTGTDSATACVVIAARAVLAEDAPAGTTPEVALLLDGVEFPSTPMNGVNLLTIELPAGTAHTAQAVGRIAGSGEEVFSPVVPFKVKSAPDADGNGLADAPFAALPAPGMAWGAALSENGCTKAVSMVRLFPDGDDNLQLLSYPGDNSRVLAVKVPGALLGPGEETVLVAVMACDEDSLFLPDTEGPPVQDRPGDPVPSGAFLFLTLLTRENGAVFEIAPARLAEFPLEIALSGMKVDAGYSSGLWGWPASLGLDGTGPRMAPGDGALWNRGSLLTTAPPERNGGVLLARLTSTGTYAPFQIGRPPRLEVTPGGAGHFSFGIVRLNQAETRVFTLANTGSEAITGEAVIQDASGVFALVRPAVYTIEPGKTAEISLQFVPPAERDYAAVLFLTGGVDSPFVMGVSGTGSAKPPKLGTVFGCGPAGDGHSSPWADMAVVLLLAVLLAARRGRGTVRNRR